MGSRLVATLDLAGSDLLTAETRISSVLQHPSTSYWLRDALARALDRDPVDAVDDAEALHELLAARATAVIDCLHGAIEVAPALSR